MPDSLPTQDFLEVEKIKNGVLILKNKGLRTILITSSLNFALKSDDEQKAIIYQFQNFLNSLDFSCQILVQSRRLNFTGYIDKLKEIEKNEKNELLRVQISEYIKFITSIIKEGLIMQKNFFVIVPFAPAEVEMIDSEKTKKISTIFTLTDEQFYRARIQLLQRTEFVLLGLRACGLECALLNNLEIIELLWALHHPIEAERGYYPIIPPEFENI